MSFTTYATAVAGSILTAAFWNQQVRDNGNILKTSINNDGSLHGCARLLDKSTTEQDVTNTAVETSVYSYSVPGGTLSTSNIIRLILTGYVDLSVTSRTLTIRVKWGGSTVATGVIVTTASTKGGVLLTVLLNANNATNSQRLVATIQQMADNAVETDGTFSGACTLRTVAVPSLAVDSTSAQTLEVTAQWSVAQTTQHFKRWAAETELLAA